MGHVTHYWARGRHARLGERDRKAEMEGIAEWCREHKLRAIGGVWLTGMGASMAYNATQKSLSPSVRVIHSRIYAQALTLTCLLGSAAAEWYDVKYNNNKRAAEDDPYVYKPPQGTRIAPVGR